MPDPFNGLHALIERLKPRTVPHAWATWAIAVMLLLLVALFLDLSLRMF